MSIANIALGIDTATAYLALALWSDKGCLASQSRKVDRAHARVILTHIRSLLQEAGLERNQLSAIGVGIGPGSYTGLRVGVSTAKGLARALHIPLYGNESLGALAYPLQQSLARQTLTEKEALEENKILVGMDARREHFYAACYQSYALASDSSATLWSSVRSLGNIEKKTQAALEQAYGVRLEHGHAPDASYIAQHAWYKYQQHTAVEKLELIYL